jgi:serine phosphatase RsbU (regulator of sigma subunit)
MYGRSRLAETAWAHRRQAAVDLAQTIESDLTAFTAGAPTYDDFTLVVARGKP